MIDKGRQPEKKMKNCGESRLAWSSILVVKDGEMGGGTMRISACSYFAPKQSFANLFSLEV